MTLTNQIISLKLKRDVVPGELVEIPLDLILANDITAPVAICEFEKFGFEKVLEPTKVVFVLDHFTPCKDIKSANLCQNVKAFAKKHNISHLYDVGEMGIEHALIPEKALILPQEIAIGADSHTCTYGAIGAFSTGVGSTDIAYSLVTNRCWFKIPKAIKIVLKNKPAKYVTGKDIILHLIGLLKVDGALYQSLEFTGDGVSYLSIDDRFTICNMAIECGAKNGIFEVDEITMDYLKDKTSKTFLPLKVGNDSDYERIIEIDLSQLSPTVAFPYLPENTRTFDNIDKNIEIHQVIIGSCTNGRLSDLRNACSILKGRKVKKGVKLIVIPATNKIYLEALREGLIEIFIESGGIVSTSTCGPCLGGHMGVLANFERCVSTTNRNFVGRMGDMKSEIYLASPYVAVSSAILGRLASPWEIE